MKRLLYAKGGELSVCNKDPIFSISHLSGYSCVNVTRSIYLEEIDLIMTGSWASFLGSRYGI